MPTEGVRMKAKWCWLARQTRKGWRLGLCIGSAPPLYVPVWFESEKEINRVLQSGKTVFVEMASHGH